MKKTILSSIMIIAAVVSLSAEQTIRSEDVGAFNTVSLTGNIGAELIASDVNKVEIILTDVDINKFKWSNKNGVLSFELNSGPKGRGRADMKIYYAGDLSAITVSGSELITDSPLMGNMLKLSANGGATVTAEFVVTDLELSITGNSAAQFSGAAKYLTVHSTEKSKVDARTLESVSVEVDAATGAEVYINVSERLIANAKSTSTIFYRGKPTIMKDKTSKMSSGMMGSSVLYIGD